MARNPRYRRWTFRSRLSLILGVTLFGTASVLAVAINRVRSHDTQPEPVRTQFATAAAPRTNIGINLFGLATHNRQQVFVNLIAQSEWFTSTGEGWSAMPAAQIDPRGSIRFLRPGQRAPRPLVLPPPSLSQVSIRCTFAGRGRLSAGGVARLTAERADAIDIVLVATGAVDEGGWIQLDATDPNDPLRDIECRDPKIHRNVVYDIAFLETLKDFSAIRFLDWQRVNDNPLSRWNKRVLPDDSSQSGPGGVAIEHMVRLANDAEVDPWFLMPYDADATYVEGFARKVHATLAPDRIVYVELGNEIWNDMFRAAQQARAEGVSAGLARDPFKAQMHRYAQKARSAMQIWTRIYADRPTQLVRIVSTHNAYPQAAEMILGFEDIPRWVDALAIAPYIHLDIEGRTARDVDWIFGEMDRAIDATLAFALENQSIATRYGKRLIAYEGGQHLVTRNISLASLLQRDQRMAEVYSRYLNRWQTRIGDRMMLYASVAPIGEYGAWGLREYGGQPDEQAPKLRAVRAFIAGEL